MVKTDTERLVQAFRETVQERIQSSRRHDLTITETIDEDLRILENSADELASLIQQIVAGERRRRNASIHINQLPVELLGRIFSLSLQPRSSSFLITLRRVAHRWLEIVDGSPTLWDLVSSEDPAFLWQQALVKSKDSALDIRYPYHGQPIAAFLESILQQEHRWRSIKLYNVPQHIVDRLLAAPADRLEALIVARTHRGFPFVDLHTTLSSQDRFLLGRFKRLELRRLGEIDLSMDQLMDVLRSSPSLVTLALQGIMPRDSNTPLPPTRRPVELHRLTELSIVDIPRQSTRDFILHLRIPGCATLNITNTGWIANDISILHDSMSHLDAPIRSMLERAPHVEVISRDYELTISAYPAVHHEIFQSPVIRLGLVWLVDMPRTGGYMDRLIKIMETSPSMPYISLITDDQLPLSTLHPILNVACPIFRLTVTCDSGARHFVDRLSSPNRDWQKVAGAVGWLLPNLQYLTLEDYEGDKIGMESVEKMIRRRYGLACEGDADDGQMEDVERTDLPAPLERLVIRGDIDFTVDDLEALEAVIGEGKVLLEHCKVDSGVNWPNTDSE